MPAPVLQIVITIVFYSFGVQLDQRVSIMKTKITPLLLAIFICTPAVAEKPQWAGQGKPTSEQKAAHQEAMQAKEEMGKQQGKSTEQMKQGKADQADRSKTMEKSQNRHMEQEQKQTGQATQAGKQTQEKKRKWWKFWGD